LGKEIAGDLAGGAADMDSSGSRTATSAFKVRKFARRQLSAGSLGHLLRRPKRGLDKCPANGVPDFGRQSHA